MNNLPLLNDLRVFMLVARRAGFAAAAEELGVSPAFVSKRVSLLEQTLTDLELSIPWDDWYAAAVNFAKNFGSGLVSSGSGFSCGR